MAGCVGSLVALVLFAFLIGWIDDHFGGDAAATVFAIVTIVGGAIAGFFQWSRRRQVRRLVANIVQNAREGYQGPMEVWANEDTRFDPDTITIKQAVAATVAAYGDRDVVARLLAEGFDEIVAEDLSRVFGGNRARRVYDDLLNLADPQGALPTILGFVAGFRWSRRDW